MSETDDRLPIVCVIDGEARADSRDVAAYFRKRHGDVLRAVRDLQCSDDFRRRNFASFKINDLQGEGTSHVTMTKDGFSFLVMGFTGAAAAVFKEGYIARFNAMEEELRAWRPQVPALPQSFAEALRLAADQATEIERQSGVIAAQAPKIEAHSRLMEADGSLCIRDAAKSLQIRPIDLKTYLVTNRWIYQRPGTREWVAYQARIITGLITHKVTTVPHDDGHDRIRTQVRITPKGLARLAEELALA